MAPSVKCGVNNLSAKLAEVIDDRWWALTTHSCPPVKNRWDMREWSEMTEELVQVG